MSESKNNEEQVMYKLVQHLYGDRVNPEGLEAVRKAS